MLSIALILLSVLSLQIGTPIANDASLTGSYSLGWAPRSRPAMQDGRAYLATLDGRITAFDIHSNELVWQAVPGEVADGSVVVANGNVYVPGNKGTLYLLDSETGATLHATSLGTQWLASPLVFGDTVVVASADGQINFLDSETLAVQEQIVVGTSLEGSGIRSGGLAIYTLSDGLVVAFDVEEMAMRWTVAAGTNAGPLYAMEQGNVLVAGTDGTLTKLSWEDGASIWQQAVEGRPLEFATTTHGLLVTTDKSLMVNLDVDTGEILWQQVLRDRAVFSAGRCEEQCIISNGPQMVASISTESGAITELTVAPDSAIHTLVLNEDVLVVTTVTGDILLWRLQES